MHDNVPVSASKETALSHLSLAIELLSNSIFQRTSKTIEHTTCQNSRQIIWVFNDLSQNYPDIYRAVLDQWILELWCWESYPNSRFFDKHPVNIYVWIDLAREIGTQIKIDTFGSSTRYIRWWVDMFTYLERLPDNSIPYCFLSFLDAYIMNGEGRRLSELLDRKVQNHIFVIDSAVRSNKVIRFSWGFSLESITI